MLRQGLILSTVVIAAVAPAAIAAKPPKPPKPSSYTVTLDAKPNPVVFGAVTTLSGALTGPTVSGVTIRLEQDTTAPFGDKYSPTGLTATTAPNGRWSLAAKPPVNVQYRAVAQTSPSTASPARRVLVRTRVGFLVSDSTPARGRFVRFSGSVLPAHDGLLALIQRRTSTGSFVTVARTPLTDAGTARSVYHRRVRIVRSGVYRVKVAGHADHATGFSRTRAITVH